MVYGVSDILSRDENGVILNWDNGQIAGAQITSGPGMKSTPA